MPTDLQLAEELDQLKREVNNGIPMSLLCTCSLAMFELIVVGKKIERNKIERNKIDKILNFWDGNSEHIKNEDTKQQVNKRIGLYRRQLKALDAANEKILATEEAIKQLDDDATDEEKKAAEDAIAEFRTAIQGADKKNIEDKTKVLTNVSSKLVEKIQAKKQQPVTTSPETTPETTSETGETIRETSPKGVGEFKPPQDDSHYSNTTEERQTACAEAGQKNKKTPTLRKRQKTRGGRRTSLFPHFGYKIDEFSVQHLSNLMDLMLTFPSAASETRDGQTERRDGKIKTRINQIKKSIKVDINKRKAISDDFKYAYKHLQRLLRLDFPEKLKLDLLKEKLNALSKCAEEKYLQMITDFSEEHINNLMEFITTFKPNEESPETKDRMGAAITRIKTSIDKSSETSGNFERAYKHLQRLLRLDFPANLKPGLIKQTLNALSECAEKKLNDARIATMPSQVRLSV